MHMACYIASAYHAPVAASDLCCALDIRYPDKETAGKLGQPLLYHIVSDDGGDSAPSLVPNDNKSCNGDI